MKARGGLDTCFVELRSVVLNCRLSLCYSRRPLKRLVLFDNKQCIKLFFLLHPTQLSTQHPYLKARDMVLCLCYCPRGNTPVILLDWRGVDLRSNPLHPPNIRFYARSAAVPQCRHILYIESFGTVSVLYVTSRK